MVSGKTVLAQICYGCSMTHLRRVQVVSVWLEGNILGTLLNYLVEKDPVAQAHKRNVEELNQFIEAKLLPPETASRLFKHVEFQYQKTKESLVQASVQLPRKGIKFFVCNLNSLF